MHSTISRRQLLRIAAYGSAGIALAACGATPTAQVIKETVVVEKEKTVEQTVQVEVTKEVEKKVEVEVTKQVEVTAVPTKGPQILEVWDTQEPNKDTVDKVKKEGGYDYPQIVKGELFKQDHPDVELTWRNNGWDVGLRQNVIAALMAGTQPDVIVGEFQLSEYASIGALVPLDDEMSPELKADIVPVTYKSTMWQGKIHGLAWNTADFQMGGRNNLLEDAGIAMPKNLDEMVAMTEKATKKGAPNYFGYAFESPLPPGSTFGCHLRFDNFFYANNATFEKQDDPYHPWYDNPAAYPIWEAYRKLEPLLKPGMFIGGGADGELTADRAAMSIFMSNYIASTFGSKTSNPPVDPFAVTTASFPGPTVTSTIVCNFQNGVLTASKNKELGVAWVLNGVRSEVQDLVGWYRHGQMPTSKASLTKLIDAPEDRNWNEGANWKWKPKELDVFYQAMRDGSLNVVPVYVKEAGKLSDVFRDLTVDCVMKKDTPIESICKDYQKIVDDTLAAA